MPIATWLCEKCHTRWRTEDAAASCEALHLEPYSYRALSWVEADPDDCNLDDTRLRHFPAVIEARLNFAGKDPKWIADNVATYKIDLSYLRK